ncbi:hypothetical protein VTG60DRAFT_5572 [Thermothelomyces hinnuleus]
MISSWEAIARYKLSEMQEPKSELAALFAAPTSERSFEICSKPEPETLAKRANVPPNQNNVRFHRPTGISANDGARRVFQINRVPLPKSRGYSAFDWLGPFCAPGHLFKMLEQSLGCVSGAMSAKVKALRWSTLYGRAETRMPSSTHRAGQTSWTSLRCRNLRNVRRRWLSWVRAASDF